MSDFKLNFKEIQVGDVLVEFPKYYVNAVKPNGLLVKIIESHGSSHKVNGLELMIEKSYVEQNFLTGSEYTTTVKVTREDKRDGTPGIRTIFERIGAGHPFTAEYQKKNEVLSDTKAKKLRDEQLIKAVEKISSAQTGKTGVARVAKEVVMEIQANPITTLIPGEMRVLRGYKLTDEVPRDGLYTCLDIDIMQQRPVNITTLSRLVYNGVMYIVE